MAPAEINTRDPLMNISTIVFGGFVFFFLWRGYQKGFIGSITRIASWAIAYPAAIYLTNPLAKFIFTHSALDGMIVYFIAGSVIFLIVSLSISKLLNSFAASIPNNRITENSSKIGGAIVGCFVGGIVGLLAVYAIDLTQKPATLASQNTNSQETFYVPPIKPDLEKAPIAEASPEAFINSNAKKLVSNIAATAIDLTLKDITATNFTKAFAENPQSMLGHIQQLNNDGQIKALLADSTVQGLLTRGDVNALTNNQEFQSLMNNTDMQAILENVSDEKTGKPSQQIAAEKMVAAWGRANALKNDPRVIAIITDPDFQQQLNSSNKLPLLTNPKLKMLTELIFNNTSATAIDTAKQIDRYEIKDVSSIEETQQPATNEDTKTDKTIYRWTDADGKVHYSDKQMKQ